MKFPRTAILGCLLLAGMITGCSKSETPKTDAASAAGNSKAVLTLDWKPEPEFGGFYAAQKDGDFSNNKLDIDIKSAGEGADTWQLVDSGKTDFATTAADQVLIARAKGADVIAFFAVYQTNPQGILVHKARGFSKLEDVFTHDGVLEAEDNSWLSFLKKKYPNGKVTLKAQPDIADFLNNANYSIQCFVTSEPITATRKQSDPQTFLIADSGFNPYVTVVICRGDMWRKEPEKVKAMAAACRAGWRAYLDDPSSANAVMGGLNKEMDAQTFKEAAAAQKALIETDETKKNGLGTMTAERWNALAGQLLDLKLLDKPAKVEDCFVNP